MPVRLQRKVRKKRVKAAKRRDAIKRLLFIPTIKRIDRETICHGFVENNK